MLHKDNLISRSITYNSKTEATDQTEATDHFVYITLLIMQYKIILGLYTMD